MLQGIPAKQIVQVKLCFDKLQNYCNAVYLGGSQVDPVIDHPHDFDYIWYIKSEYLYEFITTLQDIRASFSSEDLLIIDISQLELDPYTRITWFSYLDKFKIKLFGESVCPHPDIIVESRQEFIKDLKQKAIIISEDDTLKPKRWYHILRGVYILLNNSYDVTDEQKREINILHDLSEGWEEIRDKTIQLLEALN